ncbi:MAG: 50S ribosomal protein L16 [Parcubacteria group bacterium SW_4_49_11]|nr:MAG: 50S ribosomal protein L16 [Parcubacteria group bacterium SW_4_49_11]
MVYAPKKTKYRKRQKGKPSHKLAPANRGTEVNFGTYGLKSLEACWITDRQIEAARKAISRYTSRGGKVWIRIFPDKPITNQSPEVPMGAGKGELEYYVADMRAGKIMFEIPSSNMA